MTQPFDVVVVEHGPVVLRVCRALLRGADADDAWSETFLSALAAYPNLQHGSNVRGWLVTIAHRKSLDQIRRRGRHAIPVAVVPDVPTREIVDLSDDELREVLARLTECQRRAVIYRHLGDLTYAEIAGLLDCSQDAARRSVADGLANLRKMYTKGNEK